MKVLKCLKGTILLETGFVLDAWCLAIEANNDVLLPLSYTRTPAPSCANTHVASSSFQMAIILNLLIEINGHSSSKSVIMYCVETEHTHV